MPGRTRASDPQHESREASQARLDPVRWRIPRRSFLVRLVTVAALLGTAVAAIWAGPQGCAPPPDPPATSARSAAPAGGATPARPAALPEPPLPGARSGSEPGWGSGYGKESEPGSGSLAVPAGLIGVPVRLAEQVAAGLLRPGDRVSLFAAGVSGGPADPIAEDALVLAVTAAGDIGVDGGLLVALRPAEARRALGAPQRTGFAVAVTARR